MSILANAVSIIGILRSVDNTERSKVNVKDEPVSDMDDLSFLDNDDDVIECDSAGNTVEKNVKREDSDGTIASAIVRLNSSLPISSTVSCVPPTGNIANQTFPILTRVTSSPAVTPLHIGFHDVNENVLFRKFRHDSSQKIVDRQFEPEEFDIQTVIRSTEIIIGAPDVARTFYVNFEFLSEISEYFYELRMDDNSMNSRTGRMRVRIEEETPAAFLTFLRAIVPNPLYLNVDEFNVAVLSELSLSYGVYELFGRCEKYISDNIGVLDEDVLMAVFKATYRKEASQRTWLYQTLFEYVANHLSYDQIDELENDMGRDILLELYRIRSRVDAKDLNRANIQLAGEDNSVNNRSIKTGRKRGGAATDESPLAKKLKPESVAACQRCIQPLHKNNPHIKYVSVKCCICSRQMCGASCNFSACKLGSSCNPKENDGNPSSSSTTSQQIVNIHPSSSSHIAHIQTNVKTSTARQPANNNFLNTFRGKSVSNGLIARP